MFVDETGRITFLLTGAAETALDALRQLRDADFPQIRLSQEIEPWLENRRRVVERHRLRHEYELKVQRGEWPAHATTVPLLPYQREGMLHLAFTERALLADEMGLGKTIQAIAACALLHRLGQARRVLVRLAQDGMGGTDSEVYHLELPDCLRRQDKAAQIL